MDDIAEYLKIREANSKGYAEAYEGDGVNIGASGSHTRRGRVNKGGVNTLTTQAEQGVVQNLRIRKLTPKECWRLQGFGFRREDGTWDDSAFEKAKAAGVSDTQLYKQAGNAVSCNITTTIALAITEAIQKGGADGKESNSSSN